MTSVSLIILGCKQRSHRERSLRKEAHVYSCLTGKPNQLFKTGKREVQSPITHTTHVSRFSMPTLVLGEWQHGAGANLTSIMWEAALLLLAAGHKDVERVSCEGTDSDCYILVRTFGGTKYTADSSNTQTLGITNMKGL